MASCGVAIEPNTTLRPPTEFDYVVVVGGLLPWLDRGNQKYVSYLRQAVDEGVPVVGLCTGSFILAKAGLLNGRKACVHSFHYDDFVERYPDLQGVTDELFVVDGDRITCAGGIASLDLITHLIGLRCGRDRAIKVEYSTSIDGARGPLATQRGLLYDYQKLSDRRLRRAVLLMERHISAPLSIREIADRVNYSQRQFERAFCRALGSTPNRFYRSLRLRYGQWLLLKTNSTIVQIAFDCGFADASHFIRCFRVEFGQTPHEQRVAAVAESKTIHSGEHAASL